MRPKSSSPKTPGEKVVKDIRRATRKHYSAEDKIRIVLDGLRGEGSIAELCRREGIAQSTLPRASCRRCWRSRASVGCCRPSVSVSTARSSTRGRR